MPSNSKKQRNLMAAAEHGATFPKAQQVRDSMTIWQLSDFASGPMKGKPEHVRPKPANWHRGMNLGKFLHRPKAK